MITLGTKKVTVMRHRQKQMRHAQLLSLLEKEPFLTDEALAKRLGVSVGTIRLDRLELRVPEMRERTRYLAESASTAPVSMQTDEVIGELRELHLGRSGVTTLSILPAMCFHRTGIARGHFLFAQANSLAAALIDSPCTLTATARVRFLRPVCQGDQVTAKARVTVVQGQRCLVRVTSYVEDKPVFDGRFVVVAANALQATDDGPFTEAE